MNKKVLITVAVLLFLGIGGYAAYTNFKSSSSTKVETAETANKPDDANKPASLKDLLTKGVAQTCTYSSDSGRGTVYVSGGKVRGDFDVTADGQTSKSHMIVMDNTSYIWTDGQKAGFKTSFDASATPVAGANGSTATKSGFDPSSMADYKCGTWVVDSSMFALPSGVTFSTFAMPSAVSPTGSDTPGKPATDNSQQCAYCNALSGSDKTQCLNALNCK